jgi:thioredoxin-related protein
MELPPRITTSYIPVCLGALCCLFVAACGLGGKTEIDKEPNPFGPTGIPPQLRSKGAEGTQVKPGGNADAERLAAAIVPEEDLVFTDPDNPDKGLPELGALLSNPKKGPWEDNEAVAKRRASREGKPLLIWFTDPRSAPGKALSEELFSRPDFGAWADEKLIRLVVDSNPAIETDSFEEYDTKVLRRKQAASEMKKRYKVLGHPTLLLLNPSGEVIGRYRGYKRGDAEFTWGLIKQGEVASSTAYAQLRKNLEKKGYREWQDTKGRKVFAKLLNYHKGNLVLIEPDGLRSQTKEARLSSADQEWIKQQKMLRGIQ